MKTETIVPQCRYGNCVFCFSNKKFCVSQTSTGVCESASNKILSGVSEPVYDCFVAKPAVVTSGTSDSEPADSVFLSRLLQTLLVVLCQLSQRLFIYVILS